MVEGPLAPSVPDLEARIARLEAREEALRTFIVPAYWNLLDQVVALQPAATQPACLACGRQAPFADFAVREDACMFGGGRLQRLECASCGCVFGPLKYLTLPAGIIAADYRLLYAHYQEGDSTEAELRAFDLLEPRRDGLYLNWGSGGWSQSVDRLRARGYDVWGYEPNAPIDSPFVVRNRGEISARFDGVFSNNVIEHLLSPAEQFLDFHQVLAPGGRMVHASPCYQWSYAFTRFHVFFPMGQAPDALAERTGFRVLSRTEDGEFRAVVFERQAKPALGA
jgi:SAM-dependent methyltransferase